VSYQHYDDEFAAALEQIAHAYYACRDAYRALVEETQWRPVQGSGAQRDKDAISKLEPADLVEPQLIPTVTYFYISSAAEHLGGLGALYRQHEVLFPPAALVRGVIEHCARILSMVQQGDQPVEDRLARAYLEILVSAEERKKTSGRILGKDSDAFKGAAEEYRELQRRAKALFGSPIHDEKGAFVLRGQRRQGLEDCVIWALTFINQPTDGVYDYISNITHPTLYPHFEMWGPGEHGEPLTSQVTIEEHRTRAAFAIVPFLETLSFLASYNGWPRDRLDELEGVVGGLLPGIIARPVPAAPTEGD
jgi:hypothetical protein